jgi:hypothetical protein
MPLDSFYLLTPERQEKLAKKAAEKVARLRDRTPEEHKANAERNMAIVDSLPSHWRALVHEYGLPKIRRALTAGESYESVRRRLTLTRVEFVL